MIRSILLLLFCTLCNNAWAISEERVSAIVDPNFKNCLLRSRNIRRINCSNQGIQDLSGIKTIIRDISFLDLSNNEIQDLAPLSVTRLRQRKIDLSNNEISDLSFANNVFDFGVGTLDLSNNNIVDLKPLARERISFLPNRLARNLNLSNNQIEDVEPISEINGLRRVNLSNNPISSNVDYLTKLAFLNNGFPSSNRTIPKRIRSIDLTGISNIPCYQLDYLEKSLGSRRIERPTSCLEEEPPPTRQRIANIRFIDPAIAKCLISSGLEFTDQVRVLSCPPQLLNRFEFDFSTAVQNITDLSHFTNLEYLNLQRNLISDISALASLVNLRTLNLSSNIFSSTEAIASLLSLEDLDISFVGPLFGNEVLNFSGVTNLPNLRKLNIDSMDGVTQSTNLPNLEFLSAFGAFQRTFTTLFHFENSTKLKEISMVSQSIRSLSPLAKMPDLRLIHLSSNQIESLEQVSNLTQIREIVISSNNITDLSPLRQSVNLVALHAGSNQIEDISIIENFKDLSILSLSNNIINDLNPILSLDNLESITLINPGSCEGLDEIRRRFRRQTFNLITRCGT